MHGPFEFVCLLRRDQGPAAMNVILCNVSALICCQTLGKHVRMYQKRFCKDV